jgi:hypothetical protein
MTPMQALAVKIFQWREICGRKKRKIVKKAAFKIKSCKSNPFGCESRRFFEVDERRRRIFAVFKFTIGSRYNLLLFDRNFAWA